MEITKEEREKRIQAKLDELKLQCKGDPNCRVAGCWGRGYIGMTVTLDKNGDAIGLLQYCKCKKEEQTEYKRLADHINALVLMVGEGIDLQSKELNGKMESVEKALVGHARTLADLIDERFNQLERRIVSYWIEEGILHLRKAWMTLVVTLLKRAKEETAND